VNVFITSGNAALLILHHGWAKVEGAVYEDGGPKTLFSWL